MAKRKQSTFGVNFGTLLNNAFGATFLPDDIINTNSLKMNDMTMDLNFLHSQATSMEKVLSRATKKSKQFYEVSDSLPKVFLDMAITVPDEFKSIFDVIYEFEMYRNAKLNELHIFLDSEIDNIGNFIRGDITTAMNSKKKFDAAKRNLDQALGALSNYEKKRQKSSQKVKELEEDVERCKEEYIEIGEEVYNTILDASEKHEWKITLFVCSYLDLYTQYFQAGYQYLQERKMDIVKLKKQAERQRENYERDRKNRPKGEWLPPDLGGVKNTVFGVSYKELIEKVQLVNDIPYFIDSILNEIEKRGLDATGIFRLSGSKPEIDAMREKIDNCETIDFSYTDEHALAGILKSFLREMPEPLLTTELYSNWISLMELPEQKRIEKARSIIKKLPKENDVLLERLLNLCAKVEALCSINKMTSSNLAIVLAPNILYSEDLALDGLDKEGAAIAWLIENYCEIYETSIDSIAQGPPSDIPPPISNPNISPGPPSDAPPTLPNITPPPSDLPPEMPKNKPPATDSPNQTDNQTSSDNQSWISSRRPSVRSRPPMFVRSDSKSKDTSDDRAQLRSSLPPPDDFPLPPSGLTLPVDTSKIEVFFFPFHL
eukprot:TRINITY_DN4084_c0_g1_i1.p1 TRINITY_DN4084_c0_g1~~TRINITY_DN4084_c0_g1_i1.p1  ORF type:complete len:602 (-),score=148.15 TRINITY_DN4084_c0_g1_i1:1274-3079(-)